jgi:hypothetical protein
MQQLRDSEHELELLNEAKQILKIIRTISMNTKANLKL